MGTILSLVISNWKYVLIALIVAGVVGGGVYKVQQMRINVMKGDIVSLQKENKQLVADVDRCMSFAKKAADTCQARINSKDALIKKLNQIDQLEVHNETNTGNPLRDALNGMFRDGK